jgi:hypothetical protein
MEHKRFEFSCFSCHRELAFTDMPGFRQTCDACNSDVHVCRNCRFYDPKVYHECAEPSAEYVRDKERANFCEYFEPSAKGSHQKSAAEDLRAKAEALFKKKSD